jgi:hypothetical protein
LITQQSWLGGLQSYQLSAQPQQEENYWSQKSASQQEVCQPEEFISQPIIHQSYQPITPQLLTSQSIIAKSQGFANSIETDENKCPTNLVNVSNQDEGLDLNILSSRVAIEPGVTGQNVQLC